MSDTGEGSCREVSTLGRINSEEWTVNCPWHDLKLDLESGENQITKKVVSTYDIEVRDNTVYLEL